MLVGKLSGTGSLLGTLSGTGSLRGTLSGGGVGHGIPSGGEPGQGLIKVSDADYDVKWMSILPEDTASGSVASFPDGSDDLPMGVVVDIDPVQDLHGYDNPWPGGGGVNKANLEGATNSTQHTLPLVASFDTDSEIITISGKITPNNAYLQYRFAVFPNIQNGLGLKAFNLSSGAHVDTLSWDGTTQTVVVIVRGLTAEQENDVNIKFHLFAYEGSTAPTSWTPYSNICPISGRTGAKIYHSGADTSNPTEYEIPFSTEVYGGTLNVETGELTVDMVCVSVSTVQNKSESASGYFWYNTDSSLKIPRISGLNASLISDRLEKENNVTVDSKEGNIAYYANGIIRWKEQGEMTLADYRTYLASNPFQICYELATPITLTLDPVEIRSLLGDNNVWADTGNTTVTYKADIQKYIDKKISAAVAAMS